MAVSGAPEGRNQVSKVKGAVLKPIPTLPPTCWVTFVSLLSHLSTKEGGHLPTPCVGPSTQPVCFRLPAPNLRQSALPLPAALGEQRKSQGWGLRGNKNLPSFLRLFLAHFPLGRGLKDQPTDRLTSHHLPGSSPCFAREQKRFVPYLLLPRGVVTRPRSQCSHGTTASVGYFPPIPQPQRMQRLDVGSAGGTGTQTGH